MPDGRSRNAKGIGRWSRWARRQRACEKSTRDLVRRRRGLYQGTVPTRLRRPQRGQQNNEREEEEMPHMQPPVRM